MILSFTRKCMQTLASIAAIWCSLTSVSWSDEISGVVKSLDNRPLSSVKILSGHAVALTDAKGHFRLKDNPVQVLHFRAPGFRPATKVLKPTDREVVVFLEEGRGSEWNIATCPETDRDKRLGNPLAL